MHEYNNNKGQDWAVTHSNQNNRTDFWWFELSDSIFPLVNFALDSERGVCIIALKVIRINIHQECDGSKIVPDR